MGDDNWPGAPIVVDEAPEQFQGTRDHQRIVDWIMGRLKSAQDAQGRVAVGDAYSIAVEAGNRVIRVMGGL